MDTLPEEIWATIIGYAPKTTAVSLVNHFWNREVKRTKARAVAKIEAWYHKRRLPAIEDAEKLTQRTWVRFFVAKYPMECVDGEVKLALRKISANPYVAAYPRKSVYTMVDLKNLLSQMTIDEITNLGW